MKKYRYPIIALVGLLTLVGFKNNYCQHNAVQKLILAPDIAQQELDATIMHGAGLYQLLTTDSVYTDVRVMNIELAPSSYFDWQTFPGGRMIIVTEGQGYYQTKGKDPMLIKKGDHIEIIAGLFHWIGSTPESPLVFISITAKKTDDLVSWHEPVSTAEYGKARGLQEPS